MRKRSSEKVLKGEENMTSHLRWLYWLKQNVLKSVSETNSMKALLFDNRTDEKVGQSDLLRPTRVFY